MTGPSRLPEGQWRSVDLNDMVPEECICTACGSVMLSQRRVGDRHRRDVHHSLDVEWPAFVPHVPLLPPGPPGTPWGRRVL